MFTGIETATLDLQKENEDRLWQEGILRHVPVVGTFVNWWSPKAKETGVRGRSLNLTQGVVESTENIYKYHMQLQSGASSVGTKVPPTPQIQKSVGGNHSRSSSHASSQGTPSLNPLPMIKSDKSDNVVNPNQTVPGKPQSPTIIETPSSPGNIQGQFTNHGTTTKLHADGSVLTR